MTHAILASAAAATLAAALPGAGLGKLAGGLAAQERDGPAGTVVGMVFDSTTSTPLAAARVAIFGTSVMAETDDEGQFRLEGVPAGEHAVSFFHPRLGALGVNGPPQQVVVADRAVAEVYLAVPSRTTILTAWCSGQGGSGDTSVGGTITDALTGVPLPSAVVEALGGRAGATRPSELRAEARTDNAGEYRLCNVEMGEGMMVQATFGRTQGLPVEIARRGPQIVDLSISISEPVTITGTVRQWATEEPIAGAQVTLLGSPFASITDSVGRFGFVGIPPGRQVIETSFIGYATRIDSLTVFSNEALGLEIELSTEAIVLDPLIVTGRRRPQVLTTPGTRFSGLTEAQVDSIRPRVVDFAQLARAASIPGLTITETYIADVFGIPRMGVCVQLTRARNVGGANTCNMVDVRINDTPVSDPSSFLYELNPQDVKSFQIITPIEAGLLYGERGANGVLLLYTR